MIDMCEIEEMRLQGMSYAKIGNSIGISPNMVCHYCHEHGIIGPNDFARVSKKYPPEVDAQILEMRLQGMECTEIGRRLNRPQSSIQNRLRTMARHELLAEAA